MNRTLSLVSRSALALLGAAALCAAGAQPDHAKKPQPSADPTLKQPAKDARPDKKKDAPADEKAPPGLHVGDKAPADASLLDIDGNTVLLKDLWKDGPVVITFYRGGWCPFCTRALSAWQKKLNSLKSAGAAFVAITPETPEQVQKTKDKTHFDARVLVDHNSEAGKGFKLHFELDPDTKRQYKGFGVDLEKQNKNGKWELDAPATFLIDSDGVIRYVFADWDYKKRADPDKVIAAVKALSKDSKKDSSTDKHEQHSTDGHKDQHQDQHKDKDKDKDKDKKKKEDK
ncbi:MAG: peroxiredoxin-like family protein [Phycisphaerales bacterium]